MKTIIAILILVLTSCDIKTAGEKRPTMTEQAIFAGWRSGVGQCRLNYLQTNKVQSTQEILDNMRKQGFLPDYFPYKEDAWNNIK